MAFLQYGVVGVESSAWPVPRERALVMERVIMAVRERWFGARIKPMPCATAVVEPGGEMYMCVDGDSARVDGLVAEAARRSCYVVATTASRPPDLGARLRQAGFRVVLSHQTYVLDAAAYDPQAGLQAGPPRKGLLRLLTRPRLTGVQVRQIGAHDLPAWNSVCWRAFGSRDSESYSLQEKERAFAAMGAAGRWYLATHAGRPVGTAVLYQDAEAAQVLAVGTLAAHRGRGVATAIMHRVIADWQADGWGFLFLDTTPGSAAERLYQRLGFAQAYLREVFAPGLCLTDE
jgi:GNAT superfamily N-acetyltransferase